MGSIFILQKQNYIFVFEYNEYGGVLAEETINVFEQANKLEELEKSVKFNIHYLVTLNQKDLFLLQGILIDKYNINMYAKAREWTIQLVNLINPRCILCEGVYPSKRIAEYFDEEIEWQNDLCEYTINGITPVIGYKRLYSRIINKQGLAAKIGNL